MALDIDVSFQLSATSFQLLASETWRDYQLRVFAAKGERLFEKNSLEAGGWELEAAYLTTL